MNASRDAPSPSADGWAHRRHGIGAAALVAGALLVACSDAQTGSGEAPSAGKPAQTSGGVNGLAGSGGAVGAAAGSAGSNAAGASPGGASGQSGAGGSDSAGSGGVTVSGSGGASSFGGGGASGAAGAGALVPDFSSMWSGTALATPGQQLLSSSGTNTYRTYVRPRASGKHSWAFWVSNGVDSTYGSGPPNPNKVGGTWRIESAYVADAGATKTGGVAQGTSVRVTFGGSQSKAVEPGEKFWSDPVNLDIPEGHDLAFTWTLTGSGYPYVSATFLTTYKAAGKSIAGQEGAADFSAMNDALVAPALLAYDRPVTERLCFLGDSITQGVGSARNTYGYWVAKIGAGLSPDIGIWNLGSGWARAADAASDGYWLNKAKQCSQVAVILGVNDLHSDGRNAAQVVGDLTTIIDKLKQNNAAAKIILFTVPTFSLTGSELSNWRQINETIRTKPPAGVDRVFDIAAVLSQPPPNDGQVKTEYQNGDPHPNDAGSAAVAKAFLDWY